MRDDPVVNGILSFSLVLSVPCILISVRGCLPRLAMWLCPAFGIRRFARHFCRFYRLCPIQGVLYCPDHFLYPFSLSSSKIVSL